MADKHQRHVPQLEHADSLLVWLTLLCLIFGGLATLLVVFLSGVVMASMM